MKCKQERPEKGNLRAWDRGGGGGNRKKIKNRKVSTEDLGEGKNWKNRGQIALGMGQSRPLSEY